MFFIYLIVVGSSISSRSSAEKIIWNDVIKKIIIYSDRYASLMANLSLVLYDIQPITSSIQSKEVLFSSYFSNKNINVYIIGINE